MTTDNAPMPAPGGPATGRRRLAAGLRSRREYAGLTIDETAARLEWSAAKISGLLEGWSCHGPAMLLTSELVTNSILHSRSGDSGKVTVAVIDLGASVRVEVTDDRSDESPRIHAEESGLAEDGRGLRIVQQIGSSWGIASDGSGRTTWFELHAESRPAPAPTFTSARRVALPEEAP